AESVTTVLRWVSQAVVVTSLVFVVSATYRRLRMREQPPADSHEVAAARLRASEAAVAARDEFLAVAAHELRTPLTSMLLHIEAIERTLPADSVAAPEATLHVQPADQKRILAVARQARRLSGLIDSMLDVSKMTGGHLSLELAQVDVAGLVREVVHRFTPDASAASCTLTLRLDTPAVGLLDATRLDQIVTNLIANAIEYGAGTPVAITLTSDGREARLAVADRGPGLSAAEAARVFDKFVRVSPETGTGLGLGLYVARELARAHGGDLVVESSPGDGARFLVTLPLA
ncbi:MAG TPA: HAMP domain-containing sensor histidine kinase, partial [Kofleriaceae bacterium]|nr:HAMP domain-containing sensor histidine kinase [Kofleriaceae bacterium]